MKSIPKVKLTGRYKVCSAHRLFNENFSEQENRKIYGHCYNLHGHEYQLEITISGYLNQDTGMIINGYELDEIVKNKIFSQIDHKYLNEDVDFFKKNPPTAEWIAYWIFDELQSSFTDQCELESVRVFETAELFAEYSIKGSVK